MDPGEMKDMLDVVVEAGPRLISAGITHIAIGGVDIHLAPMLPAEVAELAKNTKRVNTPADPLADGATYPGGHVPRFVDKLGTEGAEYPLPQARAGNRR